MFASGIRFLIQFVCLLSLLNVIIAVYVAPTNNDNNNNHGHRFLSNNPRSADRGYKYAWFTREIHDEENNNDIYDQELATRKLLRMKLLKDIFSQKYSMNDEISSESNEINS